MLKFSEFLKEEHYDTDVLAIDAKYLEGNLASINNDLDRLTAKPYQNAPIFLNQLRGTLERYGMILPQNATPNFLEVSAELVYSLGDSPYFLYIVFDTNEDGFVDGYAQAVDAEELQGLVDMDKLEMFARNPVQMRPSTWYAKRDDDSGNTSEY
jgi:hypothetical protein